MSHPMRTQRVLFLLIFLVVLAGTGAYLVYRQGWGEVPGTKSQGSSLNLDLKSTLEEVERTDPGWRFDELNALRAEVPAGDNAATLVQAAADALPRDWPQLKLVDELNRLGPRDPLSKKLSTDLDDELKKAGRALDEARKLADHSRGRYAVVWKPVVLASELPQLRQIPKVVQLLSFQAVKEIHANDAAAALLSTQAMLNTARSVGDEPTLASGWIRNDVRPLAVPMLERILVQTRPDDAALAAMQRALEDEAAQPLLLTAARGERATLHNLLLTLETQELKKADLEDEDLPSGLDRKLLRVLNDRALSDEETFKKNHAWLLLYLTEFVEIAKLPMDQQRPRLDKLDLRRAEAPPGARELMPDVAGIALRFAKTEALLRCAAAGLAVERYRLANKGNWPSRLDDLTPAYLSAVPLDPFDRKPLRFKKQPEGVLVYSVGVDRLESGADFASVNNFVRGTVGFRLWNLDKRRQPMK